MERKAWVWLGMALAMGIIYGTSGCGGKQREKEVKHTIGKGKHESGKLLSTQFVDIGKIALGDRQAKVLVSEYEKVVVISVDTWQERENRAELKHPLNCRVLDTKGEDLKLVEEGKGQLPPGMEVDFDEYPSPSSFLFVKGGRDLSGGTVEVKTEGAQSRLVYPRPVETRQQN